MNVNKKLQSLLNIYGKTCVYCKQVTANTIDHIIPQSSGWGKNNLQNMLPACKSCNSQKRDNDIFDYTTLDTIEHIDIIRKNHNMLSLINLTKQYLAWKDHNMSDDIFALKIINTGKISDADNDNTSLCNKLYNKLKSLLGLYFVMIDNQQIDVARQTLNTIFWLFRVLCG